VGAAMTGLRPIFEVMFGDFITLIMDQLVNQAAKVRYMSAGAISVPLVVRTTMGIGANLGPQHSQSLYAWAAHVPGLKVVIPSSPADAKGLFKAAIRDDDPVLIFEDRLLYSRKGPVPDGDKVIALGSASIKRPGRDITIIAIGRMVHVALEAAEILAREGIDAEVIDPRTLVPLDTELLVASVKRTNRALVVDGGARNFGAAAEIAMRLYEGAFDSLDAPIERLAGADVPIPLSRTLEPLTQPDVNAVVSSARAILGC
jgi:pyruvate/2-oxoglutarate/acetoin dehydrogenase E1 component